MLLHEFSYKILNKGFSLNQPGDPVAIEITGIQQRHLAFYSIISISTVLPFFSVERFSGMMIRQFAFASELTMPEL